MIKDRGNIGSLQYEDSLFEDLIMLNNIIILKLQSTKILLI